VSCEAGKRIREEFDRLTDAGWDAAYSGSFTTALSCHVRAEGLRHALEIHGVAQRLEAPRAPVYDSMWASAR
jgi:hypothetical protein